MRQIEQADHQQRQIQRRQDEDEGADAALARIGKDAAAGCIYVLAAQRLQRNRQRAADFRL